MDVTYSLSGPSSSQPPLTAIAGAVVLPKDRTPGLTTSDFVTNLLFGQAFRTVRYTVGFAGRTVQAVLENTVGVYYRKDHKKVETLKSSAENLRGIGSIFSTALFDVLCLTNRHAYEKALSAYSQSGAPSSAEFFDHLNEEYHPGFVTKHLITSISVRKLQESRNFIKQQVLSRLMAVVYLVAVVAGRAIDAAISVPLAALALIANGVFKSDKLNDAALGAASWLHILSDIHFVAISLFRPGLAAAMMMRNYSIYTGRERAHGAATNHGLLQSASDTDSSVGPTMRASEWTRTRVGHMADAAAFPPASTAVSTAGASASTTASASAAAAPAVSAGAGATPSTVLPATASADAKEGTAADRAPPLVAPLAADKEKV